MSAKLINTHSPLYCSLVSRKIQYLQHPSYHYTELGGSVQRCARFV